MPPVPHLSRTLGVAFAVLLGGCSLFSAGGEGGAPEPEPEASYIRAATFLEAGRYEEAAVALRDVASRCESGERGRHALLLLSALALDPRNGQAEPDSAAVMAARFLSLPGLPVGERPLGETLYVLALDRGGDPDLRPGPTEGPGGLARRFSACGEPVVAPVITLPALPGGAEGESMLQVRSERDSVVARAEELARQNELLGARVAELEAELERIRRILRARPDTTGAPPALRLR